MTFVWSPTHSLYWVTQHDEGKLTPSIAQAIREQQVFITAISGGSTSTSTSSSLPLEDAGQEVLSDEDFLREM